MTFTVAGRAYEVPLLCVDPATVRDIALAPADPNATSPTAAELTATSSHRVDVPAGGSSSFWTVFTTVDGAVGVGGGGDATPAPFAPFAVADPSAGDEAADTNPPALTPTVPLQGGDKGESTLTLHVGEVKSTVSVVVL